MSDHRALAAASVTLGNLLREAMRSLPGARVRNGPPQEMPAHEVADGLINVFLYRVQPNATWRNEELPFRNADGTLVRRPQLAIDAHFLLSFYGDDERQVPNRLLGLALAMLHTHAYPPLRLVPGVLGGTGDDDSLGTDVDALVAGAGLERQHHPLYFTPQPMSHDELTKLWAIFAQIPYVLSVAFLGTVLLIEPLVDAAPPLPVARTSVTVLDGLGPRIERVEPAIVPFASGARLSLRGAGFDRPGLRVRFDGGEDTAPIEAADDAVVVRLPAGLRPGPRLVDVLVEPRGATTPIASDPASFVLQPVVTAVTADPIDRDPPVLDLRFQPPASVVEPVDVLLNALSEAPGDAVGRAFTLRATTDPATPDSLRVPAPVPAGRYLVRLVMAGVSSPLSFDPDAGEAAGGAFVGPTVTIR